MYVNKLFLPEPLPVSIRKLAHNKTSQRSS